MVNIYESIYELINTYIYGGSIVSGSFPDLTAVILSTIACLAIVALPFYIVLRFFKRFL